MDPATPPAPPPAAFAEAAPPAAAPLPWIKVAEPTEMREGMRKRLPVRTRDVTLFLLKGNYHCLDSVCYHSGGPLTHGAIEDIEGLTCVICPWHGYSFNIATGDSLYFNMDDKLCSKGRKQRVHPVEVRADGVYVQMVDPPAGPAGPEVMGDKRDSEHYAYKGMYKKYEPRMPHVVVQFEEPTVAANAPTGTPAP